MKKVSLYILITLLFNGCGLSINSSKLSIGDYQKSIDDKLVVPEVCKSKYNEKRTRVAVVSFANNSTFGKDTSYRDYGSNRLGSDNSSISESLTPVLENVISNINTAELYTRHELNKVLEEQKLQDSGLFDSKTLVEFGNLTGVRYIITGSLDNVKIKNRNYSTLGDLAAFAALHSNDRKTQLLGLLASIGTHLIDGVILDVSLTVRMIDVKTGEIVYSQQVEDSVNIGEVRDPSFDEVIGGIKAAAIKAMPKVKEDIATKFELRGYVTKIRANKNDIIVQINLGQKDGIQKGDEFQTYLVEENSDPFTKQKSCEIYPSSQKIVISDQIGFNYSWGILKGDIGKLKNYQLVKRLN